MLSLLSVLLFIFTANAVEFTSAKSALNQFTEITVLQDGPVTCFLFNGNIECRAKQNSDLSSLTETTILTINYEKVGRQKIGNYLCYTNQLYKRGSGISCLNIKESP